MLQRFRPLWSGAMRAHSRSSRPIDQMSPRPEQATDGGEHPAWSTRHRRAFQERLGAAGRWRAAAGGDQRALPSLSPL